MDKINEIISLMKKIPVEHHFIVASSCLNTAVVDSYRIGFYDAKHDISSKLSELIKDPTLKALILARIDDIGDPYDYLEG